MTHELTKQQERILSLIAQYRFLNRVQIQTLLGHKLPELVNIWLKDLTDKAYLGRIYSPAIGERNKPSVYFIKLAGIQAIRRTATYPPEHLRKLYREAERSMSFVSKCQFIADLCLGLRQKSLGHNEDFLLYEAFTASDLTLSTLEVLSGLQPDLVLRRRKENQPDKYSVILILDPATTSAIIRSRLNGFLRLYRGGDWESQFEEPFPTLLVACPTTSMLIAAKRLSRYTLEKAGNPEDVLVRVATIGSIKDQGVTGKIWELAT